MYRIGDAYRVPDQREPVGTIEAIAFVENYLGDRSELWFELVVGGETLERINVKDVGAVVETASEVCVTDVNGVCPARSSLPPASPSIASSTRRRAPTSGRSGAIRTASP